MIVYNQLAIAYRELSYNQLFLYSRTMEMREVNKLTEAEKKRIEELEMSQLAHLNIMEDLDRKSKELENAYKELEAANKKLIETQEKLVHSEKMAALGQLVAGAGHEFNNPLASIIGFSEAIINDIKYKKLNTDRLKDEIDIILNNANRCKNLVTSLLTYGTEPVKLEYIPVDVNESVEKSISSAGYETSMKNIEILREYSMDIPEISANKEQLHRVFVNIIQNACQAMSDKGTLKITTERKEDYVNIVFKDTGRGIKKERLSKVFDPFFTTNDVGKGAGLGLYICNNIIKAHNGEILAESEGEDKGATFTVRLPIGG